MKFEKAVRLMEQGKVCKQLNNNADYRLNRERLEWLQFDGTWTESFQTIVRHFKSDWKFIENLEGNNGIN